MKIKNEIFFIQFTVVTFDAATLSQIDKYEYKYESEFLAFRENSKYY